MKKTSIKDMFRIYRILFKESFKDSILFWLPPTQSIFVSLITIIVITFFTTFFKSSNIAMENVLLNVVPAIFISTTFVLLSIICNLIKKPVDYYMIIYNAESFKSLIIELEIFKKEGLRIKEYKSKSEYETWKNKVESFLEGSLNIHYANKFNGDSMVNTLMMFNDIDNARDNLFNTGEKIPVDDFSRLITEKIYGIEAIIEELVPRTLPSNRRFV